MSLQRLPSNLLALPASLRSLILLSPRFQQGYARCLTTSAPSAFNSTISTSSGAPSPASASSNSSVNAEEISHFSALASSWWDPHGPSRLLHLMNPLRHTFIASCLAASSNTPVTVERKSMADMNYLDVGCGGGIFVESVARKVVPGKGTVTGVDPAEEVLAVAQKHARRDPGLVGLLDQGRLRYLNASVEDLPLAGQRGTNAASHAGERSAHDTEHVVPHGSATVPATNSSLRPPEGGYDIVSTFEVIEHVNSPSEFLATLTPHVRPGGWIILSTISRTMTSWFVTKLVAEDLLRIVPRGTHEWSKYINEEELRAWFHSGGRSGEWESARAMGVVYVPGLGWREVPRSESFGNYFFGIRRKLD